MRSVTAQGHLISNGPKPSLCCYHPVLPGLIWSKTIQISQFQKVVVQYRMHLPTDLGMAEAEADPQQTNFSQHS